MTVTAIPSTLAFGNCSVGVQASKTVRLRGNDEDVTLSASVTSGSGTFVVSPVQGRATSAGLTATVTLHPTAVGNVAGTLTVTSTAGTRLVSLSASVVAAEGTDESTVGSHLLIQVPDYGDTTFVNTTLDGRTLHSYLRLGKFDYTRESAAAKTLLDIIPKAGPAKDPRSEDPKTVILAADANRGIPDVNGLVFNDDVRVRPQDRGTLLSAADDPDHKLTMQERREESARLYSRGGWRDHSDGNRISTTWGDKVEVVRGNYKMIVLGRQDDPAKAMGWEASGGHIQDYAPGTMPGASFWLEWIDDARYYAPGPDVGDGRKGAWLLVNTTENVYQFARTAGTLREENWGDVHESYVGSENPPTGAFALDADHGTGGHSVDDSIKVSGRNYLVTTPPNDKDQKGKIRSNPHIVSKTWAERIDDYTGTQAWRIPIAHSETWAKKVEELTDVEQHIVSNTRAGNIVEATTAGTITGATTAGNIAEMTTAAVHTEVHLGGAHLEMEVGVFHGTLEIGLKGDLQIAGGYSASIGSIAEFEFDRTTMWFVNKQVALDESAARLNRIETDLSNKTTALSKETAALSVGVKALEVKLGI